MEMMLVSNEIGEYAAQRMIYYCNSNVLGYDQSERMSDRETDCSQLVLRCYDEALRAYGFPGLDTSGYTGNMCDICANAGADIYDYDGNVNNSSPGEAYVSISWGHTEMFVYDGTFGGANIDENGNISGGEAGDQTGREVYLKPTYDYNWEKCISWVNFNVNSSSPEVTPDTPAQPDNTEYHIHMQAWNQDGGILPQVDDNNDNAGDGSPVLYLAAWCEPGQLRVHSEGDNGPLEELVNPSNINDTENGAVGDGTPMKKLYMYLDSLDGNWSVYYRVMVNGEWLDWMKDNTDTGGSGDDFAGNGVDPITNVEAYIGRY